MKGTLDVVSFSPCVRQPDKHASFYGIGSPHGRARGWNPSRTYKPNGKRECERRISQNAAFNQVKSHQYTTTRPKHVFGDIA